MSVNSPDTELLKLGRQLETALTELGEARARLNVLHDPVLVAAEDACPDLPDEQEDWTREDGRQYWEAFRSASLAAGAPYRAAIDAVDAAHEKCDHLCRMIAVITPSGIPGAGVRARAAMCAAPHWWDKPVADLDWPESSSRLLIEALCDAAGLPNAPADAAMEGQARRDDNGHAVSIH